MEKGEFLLRFPHCEFESKFPYFSQRECSVEFYGKISIFSVKLTKFLSKDLISRKICERDRVFNSTFSNTVQC